MSRLILPLVVVLFAAMLLSDEPQPTQCIRTDLNDLPPEALAAPRELSDSIWI